MLRMFATSATWFAAISSRLSNSLVFHLILNALLVAALVQFFTYTAFRWLGEMIGTYVLSFQIVNDWIPDLGGYSILIWDSGLNLKSAFNVVVSCCFWAISCYVTEFALRRVFWATVNTKYTLRGI
jgi:hypothetical protein